LRLVQFAKEKENMTLREKFLKELSAFLSKALEAKGLTDAKGRPIDNGAEPLDVDFVTGQVFVTEGVEIDDTPTFPDINVQALLHDDNDIR
jgi:hypothetical protein